MQNLPKHYIGQTGCSLKARFLEHHRYIRSNEPKSAYAQHILEQGHEYGPLNETMTLVKTCKKGRCMNILEQFFIQSYQKSETLIEEQHPIEENPLFNFIIPPPPPQHWYKGTIRTQHASQ
jgi:hypothetical protein